MHSSNLCLPKADLSQLVQDALAILNDSRCLKQDPAAQTAAGNILKIHHDTLDVSLKDEMAVLEETRQALLESQKISELRMDFEEQLQAQKEEVDATLTAQKHQLQTKHDVHQQELDDLRLQTEKMEKQTAFQLSTLESAIHNARTKADAIETDVQVIKTQVQCLTEGAANLHTDVTNLAAGARGMEADIRDLAKDTKRLESRVETLEERRVIETSPQDDPNFKKDLVDKYVDILTTLQVSKWNKKLKIDDIFTPIIIREDLEKRLSEMSRHLTNSQVQPERKEAILITSYDEVFLKDSEPQTDIYVLGKAGIGKSLFTLQLVNLWCKVQTKDPTSLIERVLSKFDYVFYVSCRYARKPQRNEQWDSLKDLILKQNCLGNKHHESYVQHLLESGTKVCLVLIDGLDEWGASASKTSSPLGRPGLPDRVGLYNCVFLTTSRPWRIEALPNGVEKSCRVLEIVGLDDDGVAELVGNLLEAIEEPDPDTAVEMFLEDVEKLKMDEIVKVPLMLANIVVSWHDNEHSLDDSICLNYSGMIESLVKRSGVVPSMEETDPDWPEGEQVIHPCFQTRAKCCRIWPLILKLSDLAFHSLLGPEREKSLVFSRQDLVRRLGEADLETCLKIGILSQTEAVSESVVCMVTVSFLHKSVQEFLAALWMCGKESEKCSEIFRSQCKTLDNIFDFQLIITFLCGLLPDTGSRMIQSILYLVEEDEQIKRHRLVAEHMLYYSRQYAPVTVVVRLQELLSDCVREASLSADFPLEEDVNTGSQGDVTVSPEHSSAVESYRATEEPSVFLRFFRCLSCRQHSSSSDDDSVAEQLEETSTADSDIPIQRLSQMFVISDVSADLNVSEDAYKHLLYQSIINAHKIKSLVFSDEIGTSEYILQALSSMHLLERLHVTCTVEEADSILFYICEALPSLHLLKSLGFHVVGERYLFAVPPQLVRDMISTFNRTTHRSSLYLSGMYIEAEATAVLPSVQESASSPVQSFFSTTSTTLPSVQESASSPVQSFFPRPPRRYRVYRSRPPLLSSHFFPRPPRRYRVYRNRPPLLSSHCSPLHAQLYPPLI